MHTARCNNTRFSGDDTDASGDVVTELNNWLSDDLVSNTKPVVIVFGHEPAFPYNRHVGDSLDQYESNRDAFWDLLESHNVTAYMCGHTHYYSKHQGNETHVGDVWQIDVGNAGNTPEPAEGQTYVDVNITIDQVIFNVYREENTDIYFLADTITVNISSSQGNTPPVVSDIPDEIIDEGSTFATIALDDYVEDVEDPDTAIVWSYADDGDCDLTVSIVDRVVTITYPVDWTGSETITFNATDTGGLYDTDDATFTVNTAPVGVLETFDSFTPGSRIGTYAGWYDGGNGPMVTDGIGVAGTVGLANASNIFTWTAQPFNWSDPDFLEIKIQMDFQSNSEGVGNTFNDDRVGWMIYDDSPSSDHIFGIQFDDSDNKIEGYWDGEWAIDKKPLITTWSPKRSTWYRLCVNITKLTATSAQINVTVHELNSTDGTIEVANVATGSIADTSALGSDAPNSKYFSADTIWPGFKNYQSGSDGAADNAYVELIES